MNYFQGLFYCLNISILKEFIMKWNHVIVIVNCCLGRMLIAKEIAWLLVVS